MGRGWANFSHNYVAFMRYHYIEGVSPLTDPCLAMQNLKISVINHLLAEEFRIAYFHHPPLTDNPYLNRPDRFNNDYPHKLWFSIVDLEFNQLRGTPVDPINQAKHDHIRSLSNLPTSPLPDRFTRDCSYAELHSKIFTGSTETPSLLTKQLTINQSPILRQVYSR